ncbi:MAG: GerMN domain-containing protein [Chloroflexaceae bacterium]|nr:GerMN domain-containing protein [Chloroflexaceae bacterium]
MGLTLSSTSELPTLPTAANPTPRGVRGWLQALPLRERIMYGALLTVTLVAIGIYALIGLRLLNASADDSGDANALMLPTATAPTPATVADAEPTGQTVDQAMTAQPTATQRPIITRPEIFDTEQPRPPSPTTPPGTAGASLAPPSALPPASAVVSGEVDLLLYFIDADTDLLVPVTRRVEVAAGTVEAVLIAALIDGPPSRVGLEPVLPATTRLLTATNVSGLVIVNVTRLLPDDQSRLAIALSLTELPGIGRVQLQEGGQNAGIRGNTGPIDREVINPDNPENLPLSFTGGARFLPLYFVEDDRYVRITRLVTATNQVMGETVRQLLIGPGSYGDMLDTPIPVGTQMLTIGYDAEMQRTTVNLSRAFASAPDRPAAVESLVLSLTELRNPATGDRFAESVEILVEGRSLAEFWGEAYRDPIPRPPLNVLPAE